MQVKNKNRSVAATATDAEKAEWHFLTPSTAAPHLYLEAAVSGGAFFSEIEVEVDGAPLNTPKLGSNGFLWSTFNRTFCSSELQRVKYNGKIPRISNENDRKAANIAESPDLRATLEMLDFDGGQVTSRSKLLRWSPDGRSWGQF